MRAGTRGRRVRFLRRRAMAAGSPRPPASLLTASRVGRYRSACRPVVSDGCAAEPRILTLGIASDAEGRRVDLLLPGGLYQPCGGITYTFAASGPKVSVKPVSSE